MPRRVTRESILESMSSFELEGAHCYDPNEETKLRSAAVSDVGKSSLCGHDASAHHPFIVQ